jgi:uncharacterized RmlC-like cupin family protein
MARHKAGHDEVLLSVPTMPPNLRPIVTRKGEGSANTGQSGGLKLMTGVGPQNTPATRLWFGTAGNPPGFRSLPHHHGAAETGA